MAVTFTQLADMIVPDVWNAYFLQESTTQTTFWTSGILSDLTPQVGTLLSAEGRTVNMPFYNDLPDDGDEIMQDVNDGGVSKIGTDKDVACIIERFKAWGKTDLAGDLSGSDPLPAIASRVGAWWARNNQQILLAVAKGTTGALALEQAQASNHFQASPNNFDITGLQGDAAVFSAEAFIDAKYRLGDRAADLKIIAVHSDTMRMMEKENLIDYIRVSDQGQQVATYQGKLVIVNDVMPTDGNGNYVTYLFGPGAIGYAEGTVEHPVELFREPMKQMGRDTLINRRKFALHVRGMKWIGNPAGEFVTNAEIANPANYQRVYDNKLVRLVAFKHRNTRA